MLSWQLMGYIISVDGVRSHRLVCSVLFSLVLLVGVLLRFVFS